MRSRNTRSYNSLIRQKQARDTKERIADAADALIKGQGYENTTIGAVAKAAGVATQTVYAIFNSKQGILMYLIQRAGGGQNEPLELGEAAEAPDAGKTGADADEFLIPPVSLGKNEVAASIARIASRKNQHKHNAFDSFGGFELLYPELSSLVQEMAQQRRRMIVEYLRALRPEVREELFASGTLVPPDTQTGCDSKKLDLLWALSDGSFYHQLAGMAGWGNEQFENALGQLMDFVLNKMNFDQICSK